MDKIWNRKSFKVGGHWLLWRGWKKRMTTQNRQKSNAIFFLNETLKPINMKIVVLTFGRTMSLKKSRQNDVHSHYLFLVAGITMCSITCWKGQKIWRGRSYTWAKLKITSTLDRWVKCENVSCIDEQELLWLM